MRKNTETEANSPEQKKKTQVLATIAKEIVGKAMGLMQGKGRPLLGSKPKDRKGPNSPY